MNGYVCFYNSKRIEVEAESSYAAQEKAVVEFSKGRPRNRKAIKGWEINTCLAEIGGQQVVHTAT